MQIPLKLHAGCRHEYASAVDAAGPSVHAGIWEQLSEVDCDVSVLTVDTVRSRLHANLDDWWAGRLGLRYEPTELVPHPAVYLEPWLSPSPIVTHHLCRVELVLMCRKVGPPLAAFVRSFSFLGFDCDRSAVTDPVVVGLLTAAVVTWFDSPFRSRHEGQPAMHEPLWESAIAWT